MSVQNLSKQDVAALTAEDVAQLAQKLENDDYTDALVICAGGEHSPSN
jgi:hypothetical protein